MTCRDAQTDLQTDTNLVPFTQTYYVLCKITETTVTLILSTVLIRQTPIILLLGGRAIIIIIIIIS
jgi:hypothetical protein